MVLSTSIVLSLLVALLRGGRLASLAALRFKGLYFLVPAILLRVLLLLPSLQGLLLQPAVGELRYGGLVYILSLALVLLTILSNLSLPGLKLIAVGMASNFLVITLSLGQMPGALDKLRAAGYTGGAASRWSNFTVMDTDTPLWFLGDNILVGHPWPLPSVLSIGDLIIIVGVFWFFQRVMVGKRKGEAPGTVARHQQSP